jgi:plasmid stabilization system protein ParE
MKLRILDSASQDLIDGYHFYEKQQSGLGDYFLDSLFSDIDSLLLYAGIHAVYFGDFHRSLAKRFPFGIYYQVIAQEVLIYAVLDCRQNPAWLRTQVNEAK